jgi:hypothetical protein
LSRFVSLANAVGGPPPGSWNNNISCLNSVHKLAVAASVNFSKAYRIPLFRYLYRHLVLEACLTVGYWNFASPIFEHLGKIKHFELLVLTPLLLTFALWAQLF